MALCSEDVRMNRYYNSTSISISGKRFLCVSRIFCYCAVSFLLLGLLCFSFFFVHEFYRWNQNKKKLSEFPTSLFRIYFEFGLCVVSVCFTQNIFITRKSFLFLFLSSILHSFLLHSQFASYFSSTPRISVHQYVYGYFWL